MSATPYRSSPAAASSAAENARDTKEMRLSRRCYAATGLAYAPPWCVNAGIVAGDSETLVIDTGGNALAAQTVHGYATAIRPENRLRVLNCEKHFDHIGGNSFFREQGLDIWGHRGIARAAADFETERAEFNDAIPNPRRRAAGESAAFFHGTELANPNCPIERDTRWDSAIAPSKFCSRRATPRRMSRCGHPRRASSSLPTA